MDPSHLDWFSAGAFVAAFVLVTWAVTRYVARPLK